MRNRVGTQQERKNTATNAEIMKPLLKSASEELTVVDVNYIPIII